MPVYYCKQKKKSFKMNKRNLNDIEGNYDQYIATFSKNISDILVLIVQDNIGNDSTNFCYY